MLAYRCDKCGELAFPMSELERVKTVLSLLDRMKAKAA